MILTIFILTSFWRLSVNDDVTHWHSSTHVDSHVYVNIISRIDTREHLRQNYFPYKCLSLMVFFTHISPLLNFSKSYSSLFDTIVLSNNTTVSLSGVYIFINYSIFVVTEWNISLFSRQVVLTVFFTKNSWCCAGEETSPILFIPISLLSLQVVISYLIWFFCYLSF